MAMNGASSIEVDYLEAGSDGPVVVLVHSSVAGARQWRRLMEDLQDDFRVRAVRPVRLWQDAGIARGHGTVARGSGPPCCCGRAWRRR